jgi:hypothetical protein
MTTWLECREKVEHHSTLIRRQLESQQGTWSLALQQLPHLPQAATLCVKMAKYPSVWSVSFHDLASKYEAVDFQDTLADFIAQWNHPGASLASVRACTHDTLFPFRSVAIFHKIKFIEGQCGDSSASPEITDCIHIQPEQHDMDGRVVPRCFDTALIQDGSCNNEGLHSKCNLLYQTESYHL